MTEDLQLNSSVHISQTEVFHFGNVLLDQKPYENLLVYDIL